MLENFKKEDLRVRKTQKAFLNAIGALLERRKFKQITVNDLCEEALTSRAAFYTHYKDKYDLLESWFYCLLNDLKKDGVSNIIDKLIYGEKKEMQNIISEADEETIRIVVNALAGAVLSLYDNLVDKDKGTPEYAVLLKFCTGGLYEMVKWQSLQKKQGTLQSTQDYFYDLLKSILEFHTTYKK